MTDRPTPLVIPDGAILTTLGATVAKSWVTWDPSDYIIEYFATEAEALAHADHLIEGCLSDDVWKDEVEEIFVAKITHTTRRITQHVRTPEMSDEAWSELTHDENPEGREWWGHYVMQPVADDEAQS